MAIDKPNQGVYIPPLMAKSAGPPQGRLLRKPRLPTVIPHPPSTPPAHHDAQAILALAENTKENTREYTYVPGASPPPPSEFSAPVAKSPTEDEDTVPPSRSRTDGTRSKIKSREMDARFIIDPVHRQSTNLGTYVEGQSLVRAYRTRGPNPLPAREPLRSVQHMQVAHYIAGLPDVDEQERYYEQPGFTLQDFLAKVAEEERVPIEKVQQVVYSRHNYKKIQKMLSQMFTTPPNQRRIATVNVQIPDEVSKLTPRVPQKQLVIEMAALIKEQMSAVMNTEMRPVIRPLPKYSPNFKLGEPRPHTEIVLYEGNKRNDAAEISIKIQPNQSQYSARESLFHSATARYFQGSMRSNSPFDDRQNTVYRRNQSNIDLVATVNTRENTLIDSALFAPPTQAQTARQPHIVAFDNVYLPYAPPTPATIDNQRGGAHLWHRQSNENMSMESAKGVTVSSKVNDLIGDATPRAVVAAEQNLGTLSKAGLNNTQGPARIGSWEHHQILPEILEGCGPEENPYVLASSHDFRGSGKLFLYRQDEGTISESGSSVLNTQQADTNSNTISSKLPEFLSREHTQMIILEAEKTFLTDRELGDGEIMVYGENAERANRRKRHEEAKKRKNPTPSETDLEHAIKITRETSFAKSSQFVASSTSFATPRDVNIVNLEFPRSSKPKKTTTQHLSELKQKHLLDIHDEHSYSSIVPKHVTPTTPEHFRAEDHVTFVDEAPGVQRVEIPGVDPGSMQQLLAFGEVVANQRETQEAMNDDNVISPSELAILDSLMNGGIALSLKAHFIFELPDIEPLIKTLTYVNLSFNDFRAIPLEIYDIEQLQTLKLRNNPIRDIAPEIARLKHLKTLILSFCLVTTLPMALFKLKNLHHLDVAYNKISFIPSEIKHLKALRELNVEGNQLAAMPVGMLRMRHLRHLRVRNNFMHPLFWKDNAKNNPQSLFIMALTKEARLSDMSAQVFKSYNYDQLFTHLPDKVKNIIKNAAKCDCCGGVLFGDGLRMIRPVSRIFGIKNLPFMFRSCSPYCYSKFASSSDSLMEQLYGNSD